MSLTALEWHLSYKDLHWVSKALNFREADCPVFGPQSSWWVRTTDPLVSSQMT